jgi:hypothetical protein
LLFAFAKAKTKVGTDKSLAKAKTKVGTDKSLAKAKTKVGTDKSLHPKNDWVSSCPYPNGGGTSGGSMTTPSTPISAQHKRGVSNSWGIELLKATAFR